MVFLERVTLLTVLGSTGSIGVNTLNVVRQWPERFGIHALVAGRNVELLAQQIAAEGIKRIAIVADEAERLPAASTLPPGTTTHIRADLDSVQRQLREVLGKDKDRLDRVWLITDQAPVRQALLPALQQAWTLRVAPEALSRWLAPEAGQPLSAHFYLVDPRGDWMMRFPAQADPVRVKKDLLRLMKANESWDEAGR